MWLCYECEVIVGSESKAVAPRVVTEGRAELKCMAKNMGENTQMSLVLHICFEEANSSPSAMAEMN